MHMKLLDEVISTIQSRYVIVTPTDWQMSLLISKFQPNIAEYCALNGGPSKVRQLVSKSTNANWKDKNDPPNTNYGLSTTKLMLFWLTGVLTHPPPCPNPFCLCRKEWGQGGGWWKSDIMKLKVSQCSKVSVHDWALHTKFYYVMLPNQDRDLQRYAM